MPILNPPAFAAHDPRDLHGLLVDELAQLRQTGHVVDEAEAELLRIAPGDVAALERLFDQLGDCRQADWGYEEPQAPTDVLSLLPSRAWGFVGSERELRDKVLGAWLGRIAACNLGKPIELGTHWTRARIEAYLRLAGAYPLEDYVPMLEPPPPGFALRDCWPETTRGRVSGSARDDDIDYTILGLHLLERRGVSFTTEDVGSVWLDLLPFNQVYTAERVVYANLVRGLPLPAATTFRNPYREWIGALIRADIFGYVMPGDPTAAARLAVVDASLSHRANGIYGEVWAAALVASAFSANSVREAVEVAMEYIPPRSRLWHSVTAVLADFDSGLTWEECLAANDKRWDKYSWVHTVNNAAVITAGLLYGDGDFARTVGLTVQGGLDTDSNGATAGSVAGVLTGAKALPARFIEPLEDVVRSAVFGFDRSRISHLAERTVSLYYRCHR